MSAFVNQQRIAGIFFRRLGVKHFIYGFYAQRPAQQSDGLSIIAQYRDRQNHAFRSVYPGGQWVGDDLISLHTFLKVVPVRYISRAAVTVHRSPVSIRRHQPHKTAAVLHHQLEQFFHARLIQPTVHTVPSDIIGHGLEHIKLSVNKIFHRAAPLLNQAAHACRHLLLNISLGRNKQKAPQRKYIDQEQNHGHEHPALDSVSFQPLHHALTSRLVICCPYHTINCPSEPVVFGYIT